MADWYVDPANGDDVTGDGSELNPYATLGKAESVGIAGDNVYGYPGVFNEGDFTITKSLVFEALGDCTINNAGFSTFGTNPTGTHVTWRGWKITGWEQYFWLHPNASWIPHFVGCTIYQYGSKYRNPAIGMGSDASRIGRYEATVIFGIGRMKRESNEFGYAWYLKNCVIFDCDPNMGSAASMTGDYNASEVALLQGVHGIDAAVVAPPFTDVANPAVALDLRYDVAHANYAAYRFSGELGRMIGNPSRRVFLWVPESWAGNAMDSNPQFGALANNTNYHDGTPGGAQPGADPNAAPTKINPGNAIVDKTVEPAGTNSEFVTPVLIAPGTTKYKLQLAHVAKSLAGLGKIEAWYRVADVAFLTQDALPVWVSFTTDQTVDLNVEGKYAQMKFKLDEDG